MTPQWEELVRSENMNRYPVKFGYVNVDDPASDDVLTDYTVTGDIEFTPSVLVYGKDKAQPTEFLGNYEFDEMSEHVSTYCDENGYERRKSRRPKIADKHRDDDDLEVNIGRDGDEGRKKSDIAKPGFEGVSGKGNGSGLADIDGEASSRVEDLDILRLLSNAALSGQLDGFSRSSYQIPGFHGKSQGQHR